MSKRNHGFVAICGALLASVMLLALAVSSASAAIGPKWQIDVYSNTTVAPSETLNYATQLTNVGDVATDESQPVTWSVRLPAGMTVVSARVFDLPTYSLSPCFNAGEGPSTPVGASSISCPAPSFSRPAGADIQKLWLAVKVDPGASGVLIPEFEVEGGGAPTLKTVDPITVSATPPGFGIDAFDGQVNDAGGAPQTQAGAHPYDATVDLDFNTLKGSPIEGETYPAGPLKDVFVELPPGFVGDPTAVDTCTLGQLVIGGKSPFSDCPSTSQVGTVMVRINAGVEEINNVVYGPLPVFSMVTPPDVPARFGFVVLGSAIVLDGEVRAGDYGISVNAENIPQPLGVAGNTFTFWGTPASPSHDFERSCPGQNHPYENGPGCATNTPQRAFLRNPTSCTAPGVGLPTTVKIDAWDNPGAFVEKTFVSHEPPGYPLPESQWGPQVGTTGCEKVPFNPSFAAIPSNKEAGEPSGFSFDLSLPQTDDPNQIATSDLKKAVVTLPQGLRVSASSASGLGACSQSEIALGSNSAPTCPDSSKIGSLQIETPLLKDPLEGSVYLAKQGDNKFGALLALYLVAKGPGVTLKLPGKVDVSDSGQLTATFDENPQLPFENLHLEFKSGSRAPLSMPNSCGSYQVHSELTSWSGKTVTLNSPFQVSSNCAPKGFAPKLDAGLQNPLAATKSPFVLRLTREDSDQELSSLSVEAPQGLTAVLKGVPYCPQSAIDAAKAKSGLGQGASELASPSCPSASQIGSVVVGAGAGPSPFYVSTGRAYLAGPYKGAPLSLAIITPAVAGPFDLGAVVVQSGIYVDPSTAQITVQSDPVPTILHGISLNVRDIRVAIDRPQFTLAPTSCDPMAVNASVQSAQGASANPSERFQVANCASLPFKPKLALKLKGGTKRGDYPALSATLTAKPGEANIAKAQVTLPHSEFLAQEHIKTICTRVQFAAGNCPKGSIYGYAKAITPLLDKPLQGPVYLRSSSNPLPDLVADLDGQLHVVLAGRIDSHNQGIRNTFAVVPDAPVSKFTLTMRGGKKGLLVNSRNLCKSVNKASVKMDGQNGKAFDSEPVLGDSCGKKAKKRGKGGRR